MHILTHCVALACLLIVCNGCKRENERKTTEREGTTDSEATTPGDALPCGSDALLGALEADADDRRPLPRFAIARIAAAALGPSLGGAIQHELRMFDLPRAMPFESESLPPGRYLGWMSAGIDKSLGGDSDGPALAARLRAAGAPADSVKQPANGRAYAVWAEGGRHHLLDARLQSITGGSGAQLTVRYACGHAQPDAPITVASARDAGIGIVPSWVPGRIALVLGGTALSAVAIRESGVDGWSADVLGAADAWQERLEHELTSSGYTRSVEEIARVDGEAVDGTVLRLERGNNILTVSVGKMRAGGPIEVNVTRQQGIP